LQAGSSTPTKLPFTGLFVPKGVAVDAAGNVYVVDSGNRRVVKLPAG
jgi:DNA-binding beta-propeller fold protein YncE